MKNKEVIQFNNGLTAVGSLPGVKFAWAVAKNRRLIATDIEALTAAMKDSHEFRAFVQARLDLRKKYCLYVDKKAVYDNSGNLVIADEQSFDIEFAKLKELYKEVLDKRQEQIDDYQKLLEEEAGVKEIQKVKYEDLPTNITGDQLADIWEMVIPREE